MHSQPQQLNSGGRFQQVLSRWGFTNRLILSVNIVIHVLNTVDWVPVQAICYPAYLMRSWAPLLGSAFFHSDILHITFNMLTFTSMSPDIESRLGSICYLGLIALCDILSNLMYLAISALYDAITTDPYVSCAIGFSGVLFSLIIVESKLSPPGIRSVFGFCNIPSSIYPWALMVFIQILMPRTSLGMFVW